MIVHNGSIIDVDETHQEKETMFTCNKAVFYIHLPQLIRSCNLAVIRKLTRMLVFLLSLWL
ncbi:Uncharacterised protein [Mycobacterium tuberculosis]|nr:Uncharacterised protein [Mycobacterium tuberculosis]